MLFAPAALLMSLHALVAQVESTCTRSKECQQLALDAAEREEFETFHSLAWRAVQTGQPNDADLMFMLARAQALSGRPDDALIMLGRLADRGILHKEVEKLDDFNRVREMAGWPKLLEKMHEIGSAAAPPAPAPPTERAAPPAPPTPSHVVPSSRSARASKRPAEPAAPPVSRVSNVADETTRAAAPVASVIPLPSTVSAPVAMAYDKVSSRLIVADDSTGTLKVVSEVLGNEVSLVSRGWGGGYHSNALVIDSKRGDLWVVGSRIDKRRESVVHRLQLISGRILYSVPLAEDAGDSRFAAVALGSSSLFVLDAEAGRIFELRDGAKTLRLRTTVQQRDLTGLTLAGDTVAYVAHGGGILRIDLATKKSESVTGSPDLAPDGIEWIGYFENSLLALQRRPDGALAAVRFRLDRRGRTLTAVDTIGAAAAGGATVFGDTFFFVSESPEGMVVARVNLRARSQASRTAKPGKREQ
jgi:hypothetical protein